MLALELLHIIVQMEKPCVTISLDIKFIAPTKLNDEIIGTVTIDKKTKSLVFLNCILKI